MVRVRLIGFSFTTTSSLGLPLLLRVEPHAAAPPHPVTTTETRTTRDNKSDEGATTTAAVASALPWEP